MTTRRLIVTLVSAIALSLGALPATAAEIFLHASFALHDFDEAIMSTLSYDEGSIVYLRDLGSLTVEQRRIRDDYEKIGCFPFQLVNDGKTVEVGYNCQTFFCVGYVQGPKICKDRSNASHGGVVEINKRLQTIPIKTVRKPFATFSESDRSAYMNKRITALTPLRCSPFYDMLFDVAVGEGYTCEEVGKYPYFSNANVCVDDWRTPEPMACDVPLRDDEFDQRRKALRYREGVEDIESLTAVSTGSTTVHTQPETPASAFPDVMEGHYGYTAINDLARRGMVRGYDDGTFRPYVTVNRAEFAKLLMGGLHSNQLDGGVNCFPDVTTQWFSSFVCAARRLQWITGYPDGTFRAERTMKKSEAMKILVMSLGAPLDSVAALPPGTPDGEWYSAYIRKAMELKLILEPSFNPGADVTRADAAVWVYRALKATGK